MGMFPAVNGQIIPGREHRDIRISDFERYITSELNMNGLKSVNVSMLLFVLLACLSPLYADQTLYVGFDEKDKLRLTDMVISNWKADQRDGDKARIMLAKDAGADAQALVDVEAYAPGKRFDHLILRAFIHGDYRTQKIGKIVIHVSEDGVTYLPVKLRPERESSFPGGFFRFRLIATESLKPFRYIKLQIVDAPVYWRLELADLWLGNGALPVLPAADEALPQTSENKPSSLLPPGTQMNLAVPVYDLTVASTGPSSTTVHDLLVCPLHPADEQMHADAMDRYPWVATTITERDFRSPTWNSLPGLKIDKDVQTVLYRFDVDLKQWPGHGKLMLALDQCAFVTTLWVNGKQGPTIREGLLPIAFDLTPFVGDVSKQRKLDVVLSVQDYHNQIDLAANYPKMPLGAMFKWTKGVVMPPRLTWQSALSSKNPFVFSDVLQGKLTTACTLVNDTGKDQQGQLRRQITSLDGKVILEQQEAFELTAGQQHEVSHTFAIGDELQRWDIGKPNLYLATNQLLVDGKVVDQRATRFGYRTVQIDKEDILLNGRKIQLVGPWSHIGQWSWPAVKDFDIAQAYRIMLKHGMNYGRLHGQPYPKIFYDLADEVGFLLVAESGLFHRPIADISLEHVRHMALELRNHPSIVMWSGSNEFEHWITPRQPRSMDFLIKVYDVFKSVDPTRPVYHSGYGDAHNHFDAYCIHYPELMRTFPQGLLWKEYAPQRIKLLHRDTFEKNNPIGKKPIIIGEHMTPGSGRGMEALLGEPHFALQFQGDQGYLDMLKNQGIIWREMVRIYREQNIAVLSPNMMHIQTGIESPFLVELGKELRGVSCYINQRDPILVTGLPQQRTLQIRDTDGWPDNGSVHVSLIADGAMVWEQILPVTLKSNGIKQQTLGFTLPAVAKPMLAQMRVQFTDATQQTPRYTWEQPMKLYPPRATELKLTHALTLWQTADAKTDAILQAHGVQVHAVTQLPAALNDSILLIDASVQDQQLMAAAQIIEKQVAEGGQVLMLARSQIPEGLLPVACSNDDGELPGLQGATIGFVRSSHHRLFEQSGLDTLDLRYWDQDLGLISEQSLFKPTQGNFRVLIDANEKLDDALLVEMPHGRGRYMVCQLDVVRYLQHPAAGRVLDALLHELDQPTKQVLEPGHFLAATQPFTAHLLKRLGWQAIDDLTSPVDSLLIDTAAIEQSGPTRCAQMALKARVVIFKHLTVEQSTQMVQLLGLPTLTANDGSLPEKKTKQRDKQPRVYLTSYPAELDGLDSGDVNWYQRLRKDVTVYQPNSHWQVPLSTGTLAIHQTPKQTIVFDASPWNQEVDLLDQRDRFLSTFWTNLGIYVTGSTIRQRSTHNNYVQLDISPLCNASISQYLGPNVQRGMVSLAQLPFRILPDVSTQPQTMLRFNGRIGSTLEGQSVMFDTPIDQFTQLTPLQMTLRVDRIQVSHLYFAHASTQNWKIKPANIGKLVYRVQVEYEDGSSQSIPMLMGRDIDDCRSASSQSRNSHVGLRVSNPNNGNGEVATLYVSTWANPYPERKITALKIISAQNPPYDPMLFAITARQSEMAFE
jgi:hypothetical protein